MDDVVLSARTSPAMRVGRQFLIFFGLEDQSSPTLVETGRQSAGWGLELRCSARARKAGLEGGGKGNQSSQERTSKDKARQRQDMEKRKGRCCVCYRSYCPIPASPGPAHAKEGWRGSSLPLLTKTNRVVFSVRSMGGVAWCRVGCTRMRARDTILRGAGPAAG